MSSETEEVRYADVPGFPGYRVSSDGFVWSAWKKSGGGVTSGYHIGVEWKKLCGGTDKDGYKKVILCNAGKRKHARVNILVLTCFHGPPPSGHLCAHDNGIRTDNRLVNLRWDTQKKNLADRWKHGTYQIGDTSTNHVLNSKQVIEIRARLEKGDRAKDLAGEYGVKTVTIYAIKARRNWKHI